MICLSEMVPCKLPINIIEFMPVMRKIPNFWNGVLEDPSKLFMLFQIDFTVCIADMIWTYT